jgi:hypothetical protein
MGGSFKAAFPARVGVRLQGNGYSLKYERSKQPALQVAIRRLGQGRWREAEPVRRQRVGQPAPYGFGLRKA